jgi:vancomycin aglycone glucosyltransferase
VTEKLGIRYVYASYQPVTLPSPHHPPSPRPGRPFPPEVTDNRVLWDTDAQSVNALFGAALNTHRASIGLPPVDNVRDHVFPDQPWPAADPTLGPWQEPTDVARVAMEAIRAQGGRALVSRGWGDLALIDDRGDCFAVGEVNQQALSAGWPPSCTTAARA